MDQIQGPNHLLICLIHKPFLHLVGAEINNFLKGIAHSKLGALTQRIFLVNLADNFLEGNVLLRHFLCKNSFFVLTENLPLKSKRLGPSSIKREKT